MSPARHLKLAMLNGHPEVFYSIQGEGPSLGRPSIFVRTSLCNLHCIWCDTDYTWNWTGTPFPHLRDAEPGYQKYNKKDWIARQTIPEVADLIAAYPCRNVILTGGEPMMQQKALTALMAALPDYRFEVETNGTLVPDPEFDEKANQYNVSPKLENSNNPVRLREKPAAYRFFAASPKAFFKYVISNPADMAEVLELLKKYAISPEKVWLMPEANNRDTLTERRQWLVEICKQYGFRYSDRLHVEIWGDRKGV